MVNNIFAQIHLQYISHHELKHLLRSFITFNIEYEFLDLPRPFYYFGHEYRTSGISSNILFHCFVVVCSVYLIT